jgi:hypothetical protein
MHKIISMDFQTCRDLQKQEIDSLKKKGSRAGAADLSQAGPNPVACPGLAAAKWYVAV